MELLAEGKIPFIIWMTKNPDLNGKITKGQCDSTHQLWGDEGHLELLDKDGRPIVSVIRLNTL